MDDALNGAYTKIFQYKVRTLGPEGLASEAVKAGNLWGTGTGVEASAGNLLEVAKFIPEMQKYVSLAKAALKGDGTALQRLKSLGSEEKIIAQEKGRVADKFKWDRATSKPNPRRDLSAGMHQPFDNDDDLGPEYDSGFRAGLEEALSRPWLALA